MKTTTNPTKTSADNRNSHRLNKRFLKRLNKQFVKRTSLPFVIVLALIGAAIATGLTIGNRRQKTGGIASSAQQHKSAARVGDIRPTLQPKIAAVDPATLRPTDVGTSVGIENKFASSTIVADKPATTVARSTSIPQVVEMTIDEDAEQSSQNTKILRSTRIPYSSAAANSGERDRDREQSQEQDAGRVQRGEAVATTQTPDRPIDRKPREERLVKAHEFKGDLRNLPRTRPHARERRELEPPAMNPRFYVPPGGLSPQSQTPEQGPSITPQANAPAPPPTNVFEGLDRLNWGAGSPPDTNGDVGPDYFIQTVNTSVGIFRKTDGFMEAGFTFNTFMSQGNFGNLCDTDNFGDPVVVYDTFNDRWIITDFAFKLDGSNNVLAPAFQCIAASQRGNPLTGGWNFYSRQLTDNLNGQPGRRADLRRHGKSRRA
ncbi:MAG TPA: hypothetical protein VHQ64_04330 [Pyrinomonadaceae bacterium]|nr:hypothetical protein [Pyrinomonadaceae bacterium]